MSRVLAVEPYYGGSHRAFWDGLIARSRHEFQLLTLPACFWKWRMRGGALLLAERAHALDFEPDVLFCSDMLALPDFKALYQRQVPAVLYMHENQLSYPAPVQEERDVHFGFTNLASVLAAEVVVWNSQYQMESFFESLPGFIGQMPDCRPSGLVERLRVKSVVLYPGLALEEIDRVPREIWPGPPLIVWNHRWEFDKAPEVFFRAVDELERSGTSFRLVLLGENSQVKPQAFLAAQERYGERIVQFGYVSERREYIRWLRRSTVSVSTALQENFGMAAVEAAYAGAYPLWPERLSYPELGGPDAGREHLYADFRELVLKLKKAIESPESLRPSWERLRALLARFDWRFLIGRYDDLLEETAQGGRERLRQGRG